MFCCKTNTYQINAVVLARLKIANLQQYRKDAINIFLTHAKERNIFQN